MTAYVHSPTVRQIADHVASGGKVERRASPGSAWNGDPRVADRDWNGMPNQYETFHTYRLVMP